MPFTGIDELAGVYVGPAGNGEQVIVVADEAHKTSCLPVSCIPIVNTPLGYNVLLIVEFTVSGPQLVLLVLAEPIRMPSRYKLTAVVVKDPDKVPRYRTG